MTPEERTAFEIEMAEKVSRLYEAQQEMARILSASGIRHGDEDPRGLINQTLNPDQYQIEGDG